MNAAPVARMRDPALAAWTGLRFAAAPLSLPDLILANDDPACPRPAIGTIIRLLDRWRGAGLIERVDNPECYIMTAKARVFRDPPAVGEPAREPRSRSSRQRIWSALAIFKHRPWFDLTDIEATASVTASVAGRFLNELARAGYLVRLPGPPREVARWRVARHRGPHHPRIEYAGRTVVALIDRVSGQRFALSLSQKNLARRINHVS